MQDMQTDLRIESTPKPAGPHWASMRDVGEHLQYELDYMRAVVALSQGDTSSAVLETLDLSGEDISPEDGAYEAIDGWGLEIRPARWESEYTREMARIVIVLGTGGPHVELDVSYSTQGRPDRVTLNRYWTERDSAWTEDTRALDIVSEFVSLIVPE